MFQRPNVTVDTKFILRISMKFIYLKSRQDDIMNFVHDMTHESVDV